MLQFLNRVGLAAGFDKDAAAVDGLGRLELGFIEVVPSLLVKLSPDLSGMEPCEIASLLKALPVDGVIATNTTVGRDGCRTIAENHAGSLHPVSLRSEWGYRAR